MDKESQDLCLLFYISNKGINHFEKVTWTFQSERSLSGVCGQRVLSLLFLTQSLRDTLTGSWDSFAQTEEQEMAVNSVRVGGIKIQALSTPWM